MKASAREIGRGSPQEVVNFPLLIGMGFALGLNIVGYFVFKTYFRNFIESVKFTPKRYHTRAQRQHATRNGRSERGPQQYDNRNTSRSTREQKKHKSHQSSTHSAMKSPTNISNEIEKHLIALNMPVKTLNPSVSDIKDAYRNISLKTHPDMVASRNKEKFYHSKEQFVMATEAHDELLRILHGK